MLYFNARYKAWFKNDTISLDDLMADIVTSHCDESTYPRTNPDS